MRSSFVLLCLMLAGCTTLWNLGNRGQFQSDVAAVIEPHGAAMKNAECNLIETRSAGTCVFAGSEADRKAIIQGLGLQEAEGGGERGGCRSRAPFDGDKTRLHVAPVALIVPNRASVEFTEFRLFRAPGHNSVCIEASFSAQ